MSTHAKLLASYVRDKCHTVIAAHYVGVVRTETAWRLYVLATAVMERKPTNGTMRVDARDWFNIVGRTRT